MSDNGVGNAIRIDRLVAPSADPAGHEALPGLEESPDEYADNGEATFAALKRKSEELVSRYAGSFMPLFMVVAESFQDAWIRFDFHGGERLRVAADRLKLALSIPLQDEWAARYREALVSADREFRAMVREAFDARQVRERAKEERSGYIDDEIAVIESRQTADLEALEARKKAELAPLEATLADRRDALDRYTVGLGGVETRQITPPRVETDRARRWLRATSAFMCAVAVTVVEMVIGRELIVRETSPVVGTVLVLALAAASTLIIHVSMGELRHFVSHLQARWRFRKAHQGGAGHPRGYSVFPFPISKTLIAVGGGLLLIVLVLGPLWFRLRVVLGSPGELGTVAGPFGLAFVIAVVATVLFFSARDFTDEQYADLRLLRDGHRAAEQKVEAKRAELDGLIQARRVELAELLERKQHERAEHQAPAQPIDYTAAKDYYDHLVDTAEGEIRGEAAELEGAREELLGLYHWYDMMWDRFRNAAPAVMSHVVLLVSQARPGGVPEFRDEDRARARQLFEEGATRKHHDPELAKSLVTHRFIPELPVTERMTDFLAVITAIENEMKPKPIIAPVV